MCKVYSETVIRLHTFKFYRNTYWNFRKKLSKMPPQVFEMGKIRVLSQNYIEFERLNFADFSHGKPYSFS